MLGLAPALSSLALPDAACAAARGLNLLTNPFSMPGTSARPPRDAASDAEGVALAAAAEGRAAAAPRGCVVATAFLVFRPLGISQSSAMAAPAPEVERAEDEVKASSPTTRPAVEAVAGEPAWPPALDVLAADAAVGLGWNSAANVARAHSVGLMVESRAGSCGGKRDAIEGTGWSDSRQQCRARGYTAES